MGSQIDKLNIVAVCNFSWKFNAHGAFASRFDFLKTTFNLSRLSSERDWILAPARRSSASSCFAGSPGSIEALSIGFSVRHWNLDRR